MLAASTAFAERAPLLSRVMRFAHAWFSLYRPKTCMSSQSRGWGQSKGFPHCKLHSASITPCNAVFALQVSLQQPTHCLLKSPRLAESEFRKYSRVTCADAPAISISSTPFARPAHPMLPSPRATHRPEAHSENWPRLCRSVHRTP